MNKLIKLTHYFIGMVMFASCGGENSVDMANKLNNSYNYDGKTIEVHGKLSTPSMVWGSTNRQNIPMILHVQSTFNNTNVDIITEIEMAYGEGKNSVMIKVDSNARQFSDSNIIIHDKNGTLLTTMDEVTLKGKVTYTNKGPKKEVKNKIKVPSYKPQSDKNSDNNDYSYKITDVEIEKK